MGAVPSLEGAVETVVESEVAEDYYQKNHLSAPLPKLLLDNLEEAWNPERVDDC